MRKNRDSTSSRDSRRTLGAPSAVRALPAAHLARSSPSARRRCSGTSAGANATPFVARVWIAVAAAAAASVLSRATSGSDAPAATMNSIELYASLQKLGRDKRMGNTATAEAEARRLVAKASE